MSESYQGIAEDPRHQFPGLLHWADVDPNRHPFVLTEPFTIPAGTPTPLSGWNDDPWENAITRELVERYGPWACGWRWARDEGSIGGGPISAWCCPQHSMTTQDETAPRVLAALKEWREWIEHLATRFDELAPDEGDRQVAFERAVPILVVDVVEKTDAGDAWYAHCAQVLSWYLERHGVESMRANELVREAIGGRFESWLAPPDSTVADVAHQIGMRVSPREG
jgi:hypothetical protein